LRRYIKKTKELNAAAVANIAAAAAAASAAAYTSGACVDPASIGTMSVKELKAFITKAGLARYYLPRHPTLFLLRHFISTQCRHH
jgi:hypothetical protein